MNVLSFSENLEHARSGSKQKVEMRRRIPKAGSLKVITDRSRREILFELSVVTQLSFKFRRNAVLVLSDLHYLHHDSMLTRSRLFHHKIQMCSSTIVFSHKKYEYR